MIVRIRDARAEVAADKVFNKPSDLDKLVAWTGGASAAER